MKERFLTKEGTRVNIKPLNASEQDMVFDAMTKRETEKDWYVLKYDMATTAYNNEIVFKTLDEAYKEFVATESSYCEERIELMFAPTTSDDEFEDNIVVNYKMFKGGERFTNIEEMKMNYFDNDIDNRCEWDSPNEVIADLLRDGWTKEELIAISFDEDDIDNVIENGYEEDDEDCDDEYDEDYDDEYDEDEEE